MKIVRKQLTTTEIQPKGTRWNSSTDTVQTSPDGGTTWIDAPGLDIRHADSYRLPPLTGGSAQCDAAARMAAYVNVQVDNFLNAGSLAQAATGALGVLLLIFGGAGIIIDAILAAMDVLITIGATAISTAFNVTTYEDLKCTFFCHIGADGQMSAAQLADFQEDVFLHYSSTVYSTMVTIGSFTGEVQYSNAGVERSEVGDCSACACGWCWEDDLTAGIGDYSIQVGSWSSGIVQGYENGAGCGTDATYTGVRFGRTLPAGVYTKISVRYTLTKGSICETNDNIMWDAETGGSFLTFTPMNSLPDGVTDFTWIGTETNPSGVRFGLPCGEQAGSDNPGGTILTTRVHYEGTGVNPFGTDNC